MKSAKVISLRIEDNDLKRLDELSTNENVSRSVLIQKAIKSFVLDYGKKQPDVGEITMRMGELEKTVGSLRTRLNILTNQIDHLLEKRAEARDMLKSIEHDKR